MEKLWRSVIVRNGRVDIPIEEFLENRGGYTKRIVDAYIELLAENFFPPGVTRLENGELGFAHGPLINQNKFNNMLDKGLKPIIREGSREHKALITLKEEYEKLLVHPSLMTLHTLKLRLQAIIQRIITMLLASP